MNIANKENTIVDNEDFSRFLQGFIGLDSSLVDINDIELGIELNSALNCLSDIEQAVIFYYLKRIITSWSCWNIRNIFKNS